MIHKIIILLPLFLISAFTAFSQSDSLLNEKKENKLKTAGYVKTLNGIIISPNDNSVQWSLLHNRINFKYHYSSNLNFALELRNRIIYGEAVKHNFYPSDILNKDNGIVDAAFLPLDSKTAKIVSSVERLWAKYSNSKFDFIIGRQRINRGLNLVWNPNDLYNTYSYFDFDYDERPGTDAVLLRYYTGDMSSLEFAAKIGEKENDDIYTMMYKFNKKSYDIQFLGGLYNDDICLGTGWAGSVKEAGFKGECTYFHNSENIEDTTGQLNLSLEVDYTFEGKVYINVSYLFNSKGETKSNANSGNLFVNNTTITAKQLSPAKHSAFLQLKSISSPLFSVSLSGIYLFDIKLLYGIPSITYSINDKWETALFVQSLWAKNDVFESNLNNLMIRFKYSF